MRPLPKDYIPLYEQAFDLSTLFFRGRTLPAAAADRHPPPRAGPSPAPRYSASMDAMRAIVSKRDTRSFRNEPVADELLERVLGAARMAGSAKNKQLTRMVLVTAADTRQTLASCGDFTDWIPSAPAVVVFVIPKDGGKPFDIGRMAQNLMIAANAEGLASCPVSFQHQDKITPLLGIPDSHEAPNGVALGHPGDEPEENPLRSPRIPLDELVQRERWQD